MKAWEPTEATEPGPRLLKEDLKHVGDSTSPGAAARLFEAWYQRAIRSRIAPLTTFVRHLKARVTGILAHCRYPLHTSLLGGMNTTITVLTRMAYGYRDIGYFFLKIMDAFPGNPVSPDEPLFSLEPEGP